MALGPEAAVPTDATITATEKNMVQKYVHRGARACADGQGMWSNVLPNDHKCA